MSVSLRVYDKIVWVKGDERECASECKYMSVSVSEWGSKRVIKWWQWVRGCLWRCFDILQLCKLYCSAFYLYIMLLYSSVIIWYAIVLRYCTVVCFYITLQFIAWLYTTLSYCSVIVYYKFSYFSVYINFISESAAIIWLFSVILNCRNGNFLCLKFRHRPFTGILTRYGWFEALFVTVLTMSIIVHAPIGWNVFRKLWPIKIKTKAKRHRWAVNKLKR
jgi:hypothetical protein